MKEILEEDIIERVKALDDQYMTSMREQMHDRMAGYRDMTPEELFVAVQNKSREWEARGDRNFLLALAIASPKDYRRYEQVWAESAAQVAPEVSYGNL